MVPIYRKVLESVASGVFSWAVWPDGVPQAALTGGLLLLALTAVAVAVR